MTRDPDWMGGFRDEPPAPKFPLAAADWKPGQLTILVPALCCPACGAIHIDPHDNGKSDHVERVRCKACNHTWKIPRAPRVRCFSPQ
jgi:predicted Zn finger-like uncharacterized protein